MRTVFSIILLLLIKLVSAQEQDMAFLSPGTPAGDTGNFFYRQHTPSVFSGKNSAGLVDVQALVAAGKADRKILGFSQNQIPIELYYFPGTSNKNALVVGGVHGSELSAIEIARELISQLQKGEKPFYNVAIVPTLFPDNAVIAEECEHDRDLTNTGRYTSPTAIDPNRQMPKLGKAFNSHLGADAYGRQVEAENALLLQLIQTYSPGRIVNLHAIKEYGKAGVYADPRTDCHGRAMGFTSDSTLALLMAATIAKQGGNVPGNGLKTVPTALYYLDPLPVAKGKKQPRNLHGASMGGKIRGVSLGSWASTAVCDEVAGYHRAAIRIITMEFPGYKKPAEYLTKVDKDWYVQQTTLYAGAISTIFLQDYFTEENGAEEKAVVRN